MSMYAENHLNRAIRDAVSEFGWDIDYYLADQQEVGVAGTQYTYRVLINGQYAEYEALQFFGEYGNFDSVYEEYATHSFAELSVVYTGM